MLISISMARISKLAILLMVLLGIPGFTVDAQVFQYLTCCVLLSMAFFIRWNISL